MKGPIRDLVYRLVVGSLVALATGGVAQASAPRTAANVDAAAAGLIAQLSVLQRAQTSADVLETAELPTPRVGQIVPSLTRLVDTLPGAKIYLVVFNPITDPVRLWSPKLGDLATLVSVTARRSEFLTAAVPAAHLSDASEVAEIPPGGSGPPDEEIQLVPDSVAQVAWTFTDAANSVVHATVANDVAVGRELTGAPRSVRATWLTADGAAVPTSHTALTQALVIERQEHREQLIKQAETSTAKANPRLLAAFRIFQTTSRTGVKVGAITASHPRISSLPTSVLMTVAHAPHSLSPDELDASQVREATTRTGTHIYVLPGEHGMCVLVNGREGCDNNLTQALGGLGFTVGGAGKGTWHYGIRPDRYPTLEITTTTGRHETLRLCEGIFAYHSGI